LADLFDLLFICFKNQSEHNDKKDHEDAKRDKSIDTYAADFFDIVDEFHFLKIY
jgi:hypothetical protein